MAVEYLRNIVWAVVQRFVYVSATGSNPADCIVFVDDTSCSMTLC